jgi:hypothetical protein
MKNIPRRAFSFFEKRDDAFSAVRVELAPQLSGRSYTPLVIRQVDT